MIESINALALMFAKLGLVTLAIAAAVDLVNRDA